MEIELLRFGINNPGDRRTTSLRMATYLNDGWTIGHEQFLVDSSNRHTYAVRLEKAKTKGLRYEINK